MSITGLCLKKGAPILIGSGKEIAQTAVKKAKSIFSGISRAINKADIRISYGKPTNGSNQYYERLSYNPLRYVKQLLGMEKKTVVRTKMYEYVHGGILFRANKPKEVITKLSENKQYGKATYRSTKYHPGEKPKTVTYEQNDWAPNEYKIISYNS